MHDGVQTPCTHCSLAAHWVASAHWFAGAVQTLFRHFEPAPPSPPVQSLSLKHPLYGGALATQLAVPFLIVHV